MGARRGKTLLIGYGNPGRMDDGLGPALADSLARLDLPDVTIDSNYQLTVEDAASVAEHEVTIFADASLGGPEPFSFRHIQPRAELGFTSHEVKPEAVLALARELFGAETEGYVLAIRGYDFNDFGESISERAHANLERAVQFIHERLRERDFDEVRAG